MTTDPRQVEVELDLLPTAEQLHVLRRLAAAVPALVSAAIHDENGVWHGRVE